MRPSQASIEDASSDGPPLVSVVVPTRDRPELLTRAVRTVLGQEYSGPIECIVVFDQSEPHPIDARVGPRRSVRTVVNDRAPGLAGARNTGALAAEGELVAFCDDDDEWFPTKLARQVEVWRRDNAPTVTCGIAVSYRGRDRRRVLDSRWVTFGDLLRSRRMELHPSTFLVERKIMLHEIGLVDEAIPCSYA